MASCVVWEDYLCVTESVYCCALVLGADVLEVKKVWIASKASVVVGFVGDLQS